MMTRLYINKYIGLGCFCFMYSCRESDCGWKGASGRDSHGPRENADMAQ